jgi:hypothetical protein
MRIYRGKARFVYILAIILGAGMILGGCAATINYSYDHKADFSKLKSYSWGTGPVARQDPLIEKDVRYYADQFLKDKGFTLTSEKPDFLISLNYDPDYYNPYRVKMLSLYVYGMQGKDLIWQGTAAADAFKDIKTDAASPDLAETVKNILMNFPPKR